MKTCKVFFIVILSFSWVGCLFAESQWVPFKTGNTDRDNINGIAIEGDSIWCATQDGVIRWNRKNGTYIYYSAIFEQGLAKDPPVNCVSIDHNGVKWFGKNNGIVSFDNNLWTQYTSATVDLLGQIQQTFNNRNLSYWVRSIVIDTDNTKYFTYTGIYTSGTIPGVRKYKSIGANKLTNTIPGYVNYVLVYDGKIWKKFDADGQGDPFTITIDTLDPNTIWYTSYYGGLYTIHKPDYTKSDRIMNGDSLLSGVRSIVIDRNNLIWFGIYYPITSYDRKNFVTYSAETTGIKGFVKTIAVNGNNMKWFGSQSGITSFDGTAWKTYMPEWWIYDSSFIYSDAVNALAFDSDNKLWAGTKKGLFRFDPTATKVKESNELPTDISMRGNYPNPFNSSTSITYTLSGTGHTEFSIYSLTGQKVRTLVSNSQTAGTHSVSWDGRDDSGKAVSSGIYLSRLQMGDKVAVGRMLLLK